VSGSLHALIDQDRSLWDRELITEGLKLMEVSATGSELTEFHVESAIAAAHATAARTADTDWGKIVSLYDTLMTIRPSPVVALNRAIAVAERDGPDRGIEEIRAIPDVDRLASYPFYWAALGEFELRFKKYERAHGHFRSALALARNEAERHFFSDRLQASQTVVHSPEERS
jgi:RNA polymerase sigma-70 factor (ECF subfamily)